MTERTKIKRLLSAATPFDQVLLQGWVRTRRDSKTFSFLEINDGSCLKNIQVVADSSLDNYDEVVRLIAGSAVAVTGSLVASPGQGQSWEVHALQLTVISQAPENYPLQKNVTQTNF